MDQTLRPLYNAAFTPDVFRRYVQRLQAEAGPIAFPLAETPLFLDASLRAQLVKNAQEIMAQLSVPSVHQQLLAAIPAHCRVPNMTAQPHCVQVDFGLCPGPDGALVGRLVELQAFPSLYALMDAKARAWAEVMAQLPGLERDWRWLVDEPRSTYLDRLKRMIVAGEDPEHVCLVDITPDKQKTAGDFIVTRDLLGVDSVCVTKLIKRGRQLFRVKEGREVPVKRIYNRMVFDELQAKNVAPPFAWGDDLDVSWCSHPNWYWVWSKYCLPLLDHPAVPKARLLSDIAEVPADLSGYVLKPLFSFAGRGVVVDVTHDDVRQVPAEQRSAWVLQEKMQYAHAITAPEGFGIKAEVRVMFARADDDSELAPALFLVRLARGKMIGVDHNHNMTWVGGSVGMWA